jgi:hypothetical protein
MMFSFIEELGKYKPLKGSDGKEEAESESEKRDIVELLRYISEKVASNKE